MNVLRFCLVWFVLVVFAATPGRAAVVAMLDRDEVHLDPEGTRILRFSGTPPKDSSRWQNLPDSAFGRISGRSIWLGWKPGRVLLRVPVVAAREGVWWMQVEYPGLDSVRVEANGETSGWIGDDLPRSRWDSPWHGFYVPVKLVQGANRVHVEAFGTHGRMGLVLNLRPESRQLRLVESQALRDGLFVGLLLANFFFSVWLFRVARQPAHLWYMLYQAMVTLFIFAYHHHGSGWVWPESPIFNHFDRTSTSLATFGIVSMFLHQLLGFRVAFPRASRVMRWMVWALLSCAGLQLLYPWEHRVFEWLYYANRVEIIEVGTYAFALFLTSVLALRGDRLARWVLLAMSPMVVALGIAMSAEVLHLPWMYEFRGIVLEFALTIENFSLSMLLVRKVVRERQEHQALVERHLGLELDFSRRLARETDRNLRGTALDLHDGVGQELAGMSLYLHSVLKSAGKQELTEQVAGELGRVMESVRQTAHRIYPPELLEGGLRPALERLANRLAATGELQVVVSGALPTVSEEQALHLYRIVQEAIQNAQIHGKARRVEVEWSADGLEIRDDGRGVPPAVLEGMGLRAIRYRAEQLGYQVELRNGSTGAVLEVGARIA